MTEPQSRRTFLRLSLLGAAVSAAAACGPASSAPPNPTSAGAPTAAPKPTAAPTQAAPATATAAVPSTGVAAAAPTAGPTPNSAGAVVSKTGKVTLPTYIPPNWSSPPEAPGSGITPPGFTSYPQKVLRSVANPPGKGSQVSITTQTLAALPTPM